MTQTTAIAGWGQYPVIEAEVDRIHGLDQLAGVVRSAPVIARGLGRSYGDSSLGDRMADVTGLDNLISFDPASGVVTCQAGVSLAELLAVFVPRGWFLPVTPGTRFVTVGGAIASDVHGKNHHVAGSFSDHVESFQLMLASGEVVTVSRTEHPDLFRATCGGMGLTGVIVEATFRMHPIRSRNIDETVIKTPRLAAALEAFDAYGDATYSVAWIDLCATGSSLGRSLLMVGEHADDGDLTAVPRQPRADLPISAPTFALNRFTVRAFNRLYYERIRGDVTRHQVGIEPFFYPLDAINNWNRLYGHRGFLQYQFVIPRDAGQEPLTEAVERIARSGMASPLAVLKLFGEGNDNFLSFPRAGYTLAVDLQAGDDALRLCDALDAIVTAAGGRVYLTKDARMSRETLVAGYPDLESFEAVRRQYGAAGHFTSTQSKRLGLA